MNYQKLFDYMSNEHGVTLLEQDMQEICKIVSEMFSDEIRQSQNDVQFACGHPPKKTYLVDGIWNCEVCGGKWKSIAKK